jgi:class 3 adenylate cyclase
VWAALQRAATLVQTSWWILTTMTGDRVGTGWLGRAVRPLSADGVRYLGRLGAVLYVVTGVSVLQVCLSASGYLDRPGLFLAVGLVAVTIGVLALAVLTVASDGWIDRLYPVLAVGLLSGASLLVTLGLFGAGAALWSTGSAAYLLGPIFGFYVLRPSAVAVLVLTIAAGYAAVLGSGPDVAAPVSQWAFLMSILIAVSVLLAGFVGRGDRLAATAAEATEQLGAANAQLAEANEALAARIAEQSAEVERLGRLRPFLPAPVADALLTAGSPALLEPHRRLIAALSLDLRGFTRFAAAAEPEEVVELIEAYYDLVVELLHDAHATVGAFAGDGIMAFFGDPVPAADPVGAAVELAGRLAEPMRELLAPWAHRGHDLGYGVGIAYGHATIGVLGASGRCDYTALGSVVNLAARLCAEAASGEIVIDQRAHDALRGRGETAPRALQLKGFDAPVHAYRFTPGSSALFGVA